jgi:hypothetical protein
LGLAGVAGVAVGFDATSLTAQVAQKGANLPPTKDAQMVAVKVPKLALTGQGTARTLSAASKKELLDSISPVVTEILQATGDKLDAAQLAQVKTSLASRGQITLPAGAAASLTISTLDWRGTSQVR